MKRNSELTRLYERISRCKRCELYKDRNNTVPGEGPRKAKIMFVGEAPGRNEDIQGLPFVGAAGKILDELLSSIKLDRRDVYITSILKCRPPKNRDPKSSEIKNCLIYLKKQISLINPKLIIPLGRHAMYNFLPSNIKISDAHGEIYEIDGQIYLPLYHPAVALYNPKYKDILKKDFKAIKKIINK